MCFPKGLEELGDVLDQRLEGLAIDVLSLAGLVAFEHLLNTFVRVRVRHEPCAHRALQGGLVSQRNLVEVDAATQVVDGATFGQFGGVALGDGLVEQLLGVLTGEETVKNAVRFFLGAMTGRIFLRSAGAPLRNPP